MVLHLRSWMMLAVSATLLAGCSGGADKVATVPVSGTIKLKGQPVSNARVVFRATGLPRNPAGTTDAQGQYKLTTMDPDDGAPVGNYTVTVTLLTTTNAPPPGPGAATSPDYMKIMKGGGGAPSTESKSDAQAAGGIPAKYGRAEDSDLKANVTKEGSNKFDFDLQ